MSMRDYAVDEYGLVLNTNHLEILAAQNCPDYSEKEWGNSFTNRFEYIEEFAEKIGIECISEFTGEAYLIDEFGNDDWKVYDIYNNDTIFFVPLSKYPNLFKASYICMMDVVMDVEQKIGKYLPETFDYENNIKHIIGTYFG